MKPLQIDLPYPSLNGIGKDLYSARIIAPAYSGLHSELGAILQYVYQHFNFNALGDEKTAETIIAVSEAEMHHLDILGKLLLKMGLDPVYLNYGNGFGGYFNTGGISYATNPQKMLIDSIAGEMSAIYEYGKIADKLTDEQAVAIINRIVLDEELHIKVLKERLKEYIK